MLVNSIIEMAHAGNKHVAAEGIENQETANLLLEMGCDVGQGYFLGQPAKPAVFEDLIRFVDTGT